MKHTLKTLFDNFVQTILNGKKKDLPQNGVKSIEPNSPASSLSVEVKEVKIKKIKIEE